MTAQNTDRQSEFLRKFVPMQLSLRRFVSAHIPGYHHVEDVYQQVALALWKDFERYDVSRPFAPWAFGVASNIVRKARRTAARERHVFQEEVAEKITDRLVADSDLLDSYHGFLEACMDRLSAESLSLLKMKYTERRPVEDIAGLLRRTPNAVRLALFRIRAAIRKCLETASAGQGAAEEISI